MKKTDPWTKRLEDHFHTTLSEPPPNSKSAAELAKLWNVSVRTAQSRTKILVEDGVLTKFIVRGRSAPTTYYTPVEKIKKTRKNV